MDEATGSSADSSSLAQEGAQLRAAVTDGPIGVGNDSDDSTETTSSTESNSQQSSDTGADTAVETKSEAPTDQDGDKDRNSEPSAEPLKKEEGEPDSSYQRRVKERDRYAKDQERLSKSWKELSEGKLKWQQEQNARFEALQQQLQQLVQQQNAPPENELTPKAYAKAAKEFEQKARSAAAEGNVEEADKYLTLASRARDAAYQTHQQGQQQQYQQYQTQFQQTWQTNMQAEIEKWPELGDPSSELSQKMGMLLTANPEFAAIPNGFTKAVQVLKWHTEAAESSGLREKNKQLEKQLQELQQRTSITGSGPTPRAGQKNTDDMSDTELRDFLRREVSKEDSERFASL